MLKIYAELENGTIYVDDKLLNLQSEKDFKNDWTLATKENIIFSECNNHQTYSIDCKFLGKQFRLGITFFEGKIYHNLVEFRPAFGLAFTKGYNTSYDEVIKDIQSLAKIVETELNIKPSSIYFNRAIYKFKWGEIVCSGSLKTPSAGIIIIHQ